MCNKRPLKYFSTAVASVNLDVVTSVVQNKELSIECITFFAGECRTGNFRLICVRRDPYVQPYSISKWTLPPFLLTFTWH